MSRVWKWNYTLSSAPNDYSAKLNPKYVPCAVNKVLSNLVYNVKDLVGNVSGSRHVRDLRSVYSNLESEIEEELGLSQDYSPLLKVHNYFSHLLFSSTGKFPSPFSNISFCFYVKLLFLILDCLASHNRFLFLHLDILYVRQYEVIIIFKY